MFCDKKVRSIKPLRKKVQLSRFVGYDENKVSNNLPCDYTDECCNFGFFNNKLIGGTGVSQLCVGDENNSFIPITPVPNIVGEKKLFVARTSDKQSNYTKLIISHKGGIESLDMKPGAVWLHCPCDNLQTNAVSYLYEDRDLLLMSGGQQGIVVFENNTTQIIANSLAIKNMSVHFERVFAVVEGKRNSLWFSDAFNPFNWNVSLAEGGYIEFDGSLGNVNVVISFRDYLYAFCDYGIYRLTAYADQTSFSLKRLYCACGKIFPSSVVECGDRIVFVSTDGLYFFDGYNISRHSLQISKFLQNGLYEVSGAYCDRKYYLSAQYPSRQEPFEILEGTENNANLIITLDLNTNNISFVKGANIKDLVCLYTPTQNCVVGLSNDSQNIVCLDNKGNYLDKDLTRLWKVCGIDFGDSVNEKLLRSIEYTTQSQFIFGVVADGLVKEFVLSNRENFAKLNIKARNFDFYILSDCKKVEISPPILTVDILRR